MVGPLVGHCSDRLRRPLISRPLGKRKASSRSHLDGNIFPTGVHLLLRVSGEFTAMG